MKKIKIKQFKNWKLNHKFTFLTILSLLVLIGIFAGVFFYVMEQNVIKENYDYVSYKSVRSRDTLTTKINSVVMSTQFFLSDEKLMRVLRKTKMGGGLSSAEWVEFKENEVAALERMVNNNPMLYNVRVYADTENVQEMMPILYQKSRSKKQSWAGKENYLGWNFDYSDNIFHSYNLSQNHKMAALVTAIWDRDGGSLGTIEAAMTMEEMFPELYEGIGGEWSCFIDAEGTRYYGDRQEPEDTVVDAILERSRDAEEPDGVFIQYMKIENRHLMVSSVSVSELGGRFLSVKDITENLHDVYRIRNLFLLALLALTVVLAILINTIVQRLLWQFYAILQGVRRVQKGDLMVRIEKKNEDEMGELSDQFNTMLDRIQALMQENIDREVLAKNSQIRALQNQINAHFIYNVLESIKMMAEIDEEYTISDAVTALGKLLRYSMHWTSDNVTVAEELDYIKNYVALINLRFEYKILLSLRLPQEVMGQRIPKMSLQPIVENAILHGVGELAEDTTIYMKGFFRGEDCVIEVTDNGSGMNAEQVALLKEKIAGRIEASGGTGNGIGLKNVQDRIVLAFGSGYGLDVVSKEGCFTKIVVRLPDSREEQNLISR
ncbi:MAG: sensor histidine kinase [Muribaculaceae bacterium]|nr:sensor histidine kinase [Roseburia sp.]MCM1431436.1 sensor histidine kinase [Muribaculaceae bacterium]MCM1493270.1 sensor histidine kinase [Muribaculaceae bacterium]